MTGPDRDVGRRKGTKIRDRVTVTFRIDRDIWEEFMKLVEAGRIEDRNAIVNSWFRVKLAEFRDEDSRVDAEKVTLDQRQAILRMLAQGQDPATPSPLPLV